MARMKCKNLYTRIIREIMRENKISFVSPKDAKPSVDVQINDTLDDVLRYAESYIIGLNNRGDKQHYRYDIYKDSIELPVTPNKNQRYYKVQLKNPNINKTTSYNIPIDQKVLIDIGCGVGLYSWVFSDVMMEKKISSNQIEMYGLDRCHAMIDVAIRITDKLSQKINNYPRSQFYTNEDAFLKQLTNRHLQNTDCYVTFGYVLAQSCNNVSDFRAAMNILFFTRLIKYIYEMGANITIVVVDAKTRNPDEYMKALFLLEQTLSEEGIEIQQ